MGTPEKNETEISPAVTGINLPRGQEELVHTSILHLCHVIRLVTVSTLSVVSKPQACSIQRLQGSFLGSNQDPSQTCLGLWRFEPIYTVGESLHHSTVPNMLNAFEHVFVSNGTNLLQVHVACSIDVQCFCVCKTSRETTQYQETHAGCQVARTFGNVTSRVFWTWERIKFIDKSKFPKILFKNIRHTRIQKNIKKPRDQQKTRQQIKIICFVA